MNKKTIKKVLDELAKETPDLSYMRGLLEGLIEPDEFEYIAPKIMNANTPVNFPSTIVDEASALDAKARSALARGIPQPNE